MMANKPKVSYKRAPSDKLLKLLMPGGELSWLVELGNKPFSNHQHDAHFRSGDEVHIYRGRTMIFGIQRLKSGGIKVPGTIHETYEKQLGDMGLCRTWNAGDPKLPELLRHYLHKVKVRPSWVTGEGAIQIQWSRVGIYPWAPFDREAVLKGLDPKSPDPRMVALARIAINIEGAKGEWDELKQSTKSSGGEADQLAVDENGRLVLLELKDGSKRDREVYYAPFQLLQYVWEWHKALRNTPSLRKDLQALIDSRKKVGLTHKDASKLTGGIRAAVGFGDDIPSARTKERYKKVLKIVNGHLPPGVPPIETWAWSEDGPYCIGW